MQENDIINKLVILKKEKNAIILAHNYTELKIHKIADMVGDSFQLAKAARDVTADIILFCGVKFMAETAKLLNPKAKVLLSHSEAGCPMADMITPEDVIDFKKDHPDHIVVCYVNSSIEVKAVSDICVTSSNAVKIINTIPHYQKIFFIPDQNLGDYVRRQTQRDITLFEGFCPIHHKKMTLLDVNTNKLMHKDHLLIVHPECPPEIVDQADFVGSTKELIDFAEKNDKLIIGTEMGIIDMILDKYPNKSIIPLSSQAVCANMKKTSLIDVLDTLQYELNEIKFTDEVFKKAFIPVSEMMKRI